MADKPKFAPKRKIDGKVYMAIALIADKPPDDVIKTFVKIAEHVATTGFTVRTGSGELGEACKHALKPSYIEQYAPWEGFEDANDIFSKTTNHAKALAMRFQKGLSGSKPAIWAIAAVYLNVLLGKEITSPATALVIWSPCGSVDSLGATLPRFSPLRLPLRLANYMKIPVFNIKNADALPAFKTFLEGYYAEFEEGEWSRDLFAFKPK